MNECDKERGDSHRGGGRVMTWGLENVKAIVLTIDLYLGSSVMGISPGMWSMKHTVITDTEGPCVRKKHPWD